MENKLSKSQEFLVRILIELVKEDMQNDIHTIYLHNLSYQLRISLRVLRSIVAKKTYDKRRKQRLTYLRDYYMDRITPHYT